VKAVREQVAYLQSLSDGLHALTLDLDGHPDTDTGAGITRTGAICAPLETLCGDGSVVRFMLVRMIVVFPLHQLDPFVHRPDP